MMALAAVPVGTNLVKCPMQILHDSPPRTGQLWADVLPNPKVRAHASLISRNESFDQCLAHRGVRPAAHWLLCPTHSTSSGFLKNFSFF